MFESAGEVLGMKLLVLGASGRTGRHVVEQALRRGHEVTALVRPGAALPVGTGLTIAPGNPCDRDQLDQLMDGQNAVISCLGQRSTADAVLLRGSAEALIAVMTKTDVRRLVVISQGLLFPTSSVVVRLLRLALARHVEDSTAMEALLRGSELDWTIVRPPRLTEQDEMRGYRLAVDEMPEGRRVMSRADLAACLLDEIDQEAHLRAVVGVTSK
ncbi:NAD-dependent epimerase/dehydratase family protein [Rhizobium leguminosarum]|uniref:NAD(P)-dependent oxidoreductase n=1 Tax=Rhizobium leguminosarum TaxID=384 RepID=UPI000FEC8FC6|nr:NAD(P)H-binding protein [Rhizobium leguminosarum]RWX12884.1 NAD-dependent epimerase/dehydratase family protein [Rhizobium leguminosarum]